MSYRFFSEKNDANLSYTNKFPTLQRGRFWCFSSRMPIGGSMALMKAITTVPHDQDCRIGFRYT
jgi:hypothetical protein